MNRLHAEIQRLFGLTETAAARGPATVAPAESDGVRVLVLGLSHRLAWPRLEAVWQDVQQRLELPAPAIAVNGHDGFALWFALAEPVPRAEAAAFLRALCQHHLSDLADLPAGRLCLQPAVDATSSAAPALPGHQVQPEQWSAWVAPDLAPMFAETPWLDLPPPAEGQAELLARLRPATAEAFARARTVQAQADAGAASARPSADRVAGTAPAPAAGFSAPRMPDGPATADLGPATTLDDPRAFLLRVMNDGQVPLALRIEAAKALLGRGSC